jgi:hypothetical protein
MAWNNIRSRDLDLGIKYYYFALAPLIPLSPLSFLSCGIIAPHVLVLLHCIVGDVFLLLIFNVQYLHITSLGPQPFIIYTNIHF